MPSVFSLMRWMTHLYALALYIGGGWADAPTLPLSGTATRFASRPSPALFGTPRPVDPAVEARLPRHELELRSASQDLPAPWAR
jgi:hypothetical protein